jgi:hypothetical protein
VPACLLRPAHGRRSLCGRGLGRARRAEGAPLPASVGLVDEVTGDVRGGPDDGLEPGEGVGHWRQGRVARALGV